MRPMGGLYTAKNDLLFFADGVRDIFRRCPYPCCRRNAVRLFLEVPIGPLLLPAVGQGQVGGTDGFSTIIRVDADFSARCTTA